MATRLPDRLRLASWMSDIRLTLADPADRHDLQRLAALDEHELPPPPLLIARRDGELCAALSLATGEVVADPFRRTSDLLALLRCHAAPRLMFAR
jgi:hypothetical protein